jgi:translation elongation factor EF-4
MNDRNGGAGVSKKKMQQFGNVYISQEAFISALKMDG